MVGAGRAHQPTQQLLLRALAEQAPAPGGEAFFVLLGNDLQERCGDIGQRTYSQGTLGAAAERGAFGPGAPSLDLRTVTLRRARGGALQEQIPLAGIARHRSRPLELAACLVGAAELGKEVAAHAGQKVVVAQRGVGGKGIDDF
jgi:hypothetical protein